MNLCLYYLSCFYAIVYIHVNDDDVYLNTRVTTVLYDICILKHIYGLIHVFMYVFMYAYMYMHVYMYT